MNTTIRHISYLLCDCDDLAVPGLGVFRRRQSSARFEGTALLPPSEEIVFAAHDSCGDDLLVMSLSRCLACDKKTAAERIAADVADIKTRLEAGQAVGIGDAGNLVPAAALGGIVFEPSASWSRKRPLSWLNPIEQLSERDATVAESLVGVETEKNRNVFMHSLQRTASSAAAIALLALIAFVASQLPGHNSAEPQKASFGFESTERAVTSGTVEQQPADKALVLILNTPADGMSIVDPSEKKTRSASESADAEDSYYLIVASLASPAEADRFIAAHPEAPLGILETDGRCRVYAASGATFSHTKALADAKGLFERFPSAWICRK